MSKTRGKDKKASASSEDARPYRPCVGLMLLNGRGEVFVGNRRDIPGEHWQMPQGGVDKGERPGDAALRELYEETGLSPDKVALLRKTKGWLRYDLPPEFSRRAWKGKYRGQKQKWFAFRFLGQDSDVDLTLHHPEFEAWRWAPMDSLVALTVDFKRDLYRKVVAAFRDLAP